MASLHYSVAAKAAASSAARLKPKLGRPLPSCEAAVIRRVDQSSGVRASQSVNIDFDALAEIHVGVVYYSARRVQVHLIRGLHII